MSKYRLPDYLGGFPCALIRKGVAADDMWELVVDRGDESFPISLPPTVLIEIFPPEPPNRTYVLDNENCVWLREGDLWYISNNGTGGQPWAAVDRAHGPLTRLVPDPLEGIAPWPDGQRGVRVGREPHDAVGHRIVVADVAYADITEEEAEQLGAHLLRQVRTDREARSS